MRNWNGVWSTGAVPPPPGSAFGAVESPGVVGAAPPRSVAPVRTMNLTRSLPESVTAASLPALRARSATFLLRNAPAAPPAAPPAAAKKAAQIRSFCAFRAFSTRPTASSCFVTAWSEAWAARSTLPSAASYLAVTDVEAWLRDSTRLARSMRAVTSTVYVSS